MASCTIHFHSSLRKYTGVESCVIDAESYIELVSNCIQLFPKLRSIVHKILKNRTQDVWLVVNGKTLDEHKWALPPSLTAKIYMVPYIFGAGKALPYIIGAIAIVAIIALTIVTFGGALAALGAGAAAGAAAAGAGAGAGAGIGASLGAMAAASGGLSSSTMLLISAGLSIVSMVVNMLLAKKPNNPLNTAGRAENDGFGSITNSTSTQTAVPLNYGMIRIGGHFVSGYIKTINHTKNDTIKVSTYI